MWTRTRKSNSQKGFEFATARAGNGIQFRQRSCRLLPSYMRWADVVHLTGVYNFPTFPTILRTRLLQQAADLVTARGSSALERLFTNRRKGDLGFFVVSHG